MTADDINIIPYHQHEGHPGLFAPTTYITHRRIIHPPHHLHGGHPSMINIMHPLHSPRHGGHPWTPGPPPNLSIPAPSSSAVSVTSTPTFDPSSQSSSGAGLSSIHGSAAADQVMVSVDHVPADAVDSGMVEDASASAGGKVDSGMIEDASASVKGRSSPTELAWSTAHVPPDEDFFAKQLMRDMDIFSGAKPDLEWPMFWTRISSFLTLSQYSPLDGALDDGSFCTTPTNAANSHRLHFLLVCKLKGAAMEPFHDNATYLGKGFEMLGRLRQTYAPTKESDIYANFQSLFSLDMGPKDSLDHFVSQIRRYAAALKFGGVEVHQCLLSMIYMRGLDDRFELLKQHFAVNPEQYAQKTLEELHHATLQFSASAQHLLHSGPRAAGSASVVGAGSSTPTKKRQATINVEDLRQLAADGSCVCGRDFHTVDKCSQFMGAGYVVELNEVKAKEKWERVGSNGGKSGGKKPRTKRGNGGGGTAGGSSSTSASSVTSPAPVPAPASSVGSASRASANQFAAFESDDDMERVEQDMGSSSFAGAVAGTKAKSTFSLYLPSSPPPSSPSHTVCIGSPSHASTSTAASASSITASVLIANSGATDHMWPDYSAFTSYRPLSTKTVTLADDTHAPVLGIRSIKILLDGKVVGVRDVLHVPLLRIPLYSLRTHHSMQGCGFVGDNDKFHVYFPTFVTTVDDSIDSHIAYKPLGRSSPRPYDFCQPRPQPLARSARVSPIDTPPCRTSVPTPTSPITNSPDRTSTVTTTNYDKNFPPLPPPLPRPASKVHWRLSLTHGPTPRLAHPCTPPSVLRPSSHPDPLADDTPAKR